MKNKYELYGIKKIKPSELELRGYLYQLCSYIDKRSFVQESYEVANYIESEGIDLYNLSEVPIDEITRILKRFEILPKALYINDSDKFANYDLHDFSKIIEQTLIENYRSVIFDLEAYPEGLTEDENEKREEKRRIRIESNIEQEKNDLINFLPTFYETLQEIPMHDGKIFIAYSVGGNIIDIFSETGKKLLIDEFEKENEIDTWRESNSFTSCKISYDKKSILLDFLGRNPSWIIFEYKNHSFSYLRSDSSFFKDNSPDYYYKPDDVDNAYKKILKEQEELNKIPFSVIIGAQEWTTRNLDTSHFLNGDSILEARSQEEWETAAKNETPAWCCYDNNPAFGEKYGKLYNWFAVSDPRGLAPNSWRIPTVEDWHQLNDYLSSNVNIKLLGGDEWEYDYSISSLFSKDKGPAPIRKVRKSKKFNETGFYALPGGARGKFENDFFAIRDSAYWWTSTSVETPTEDSKSEKTEDKSIGINKSDVFDEFNSDNSSGEIVQFKKNSNSFEQKNDDNDEEIESFMDFFFRGKSKVGELGGEAARFTLLYANDEALQIGNFTDKKVGYSVRCIRNK